MKLETTDVITGSPNKRNEKESSNVYCAFCILDTNDAYRSHRKKMVELKNSFYTFWTQQPINKNKMKSQFQTYFLRSPSGHFELYLSSVFSSAFNHDQFHALLYWIWWGLSLFVFDTIQLYIYDLKLNKELTFDPNRCIFYT